MNFKQLSNRIKEIIAGPDPTTEETETPSIIVKEPLL